MQKNSKTYTLTVTAVLIAVGLVLPFVTGQIPAIAKIISPMHIPAYICGLTCGVIPGIAMGVITPLLRCVLFGMPALPSAIPMCFELSVYAAICGFAYPRLRAVGSHLWAMLGAMAAAMVLGRIVGGAAKALVMGVTGNGYSFGIFFTAYFVNSAPGALIHLVLVPAVVAALEKAKLSPLCR